VNVVRRGQCIQPTCLDGFSAARTSLSSSRFGSMSAPIFTTTTSHPVVAFPNFGAKHSLLSSTPRQGSSPFIANNERPFKKNLQHVEELEIIYRAPLSERACFLKHCAHLRRFKMILQFWDQNNKLLFGPVERCCSP